MKTAEYRLFVDPTESRVARNESDFYTFRVPLAMLCENDQNLLQVLIDTGNVAFGHNRPGNQKVVVTCPKGASRRLQWIKTSLPQFDVEIREQAGNRFVEFTGFRGCSLGCVDRRLDDTGVDIFSKEGQITHAGGPLVLDPKLESEMPGAHRASLVRALKYASENGAPVNSLNYHFGAEGSSGCGMYNALTSANPRIREVLNHPGDIVKMMRRVRDHYGRILSTECRITASVVLGSKDSITFSPEDPADYEALLAEKDLVL